MNELRTSINTGFTKKTAPIAKPGNLHTLRVANKSASEVYIHIFDRATAPANADTPSCAPIGPVPAGGGYETDTRFDFKDGLVIAASSTQGALTLIAADDVWFTAQIDV